MQQWAEYKNTNLIGCTHILLHFKYYIGDVFLSSNGKLAVFTPVYSGLYSDNQQIQVDSAFYPETGTIMFRIIYIGSNIKISDIILESVLYSKII